MGSVRTFPIRNAHSWRWESKRDHATFEGACDVGAPSRTSLLSATPRSAGDRYMANQRMSHSRANTLVDRKAYFHPRRYTRKPTAKGASVAPIFVPELKMPVAKARSL